MDCHQFILDNFQRLNGKLYRPRSDGNYLILALMNEENSDMWESLKIKPATIEREAARGKALLDSLQTHFHVSPPFKLETGFHVDRLDNVGTLEGRSRPERRNILTGLVRKTDADYADFRAHAARSYTMERIPSSVNVMDIRYFLPMVGEDIDGYYGVEKVYFGTRKGLPCLKLNLSAYVPLGKDKVKIYRVRMQPGELITYEQMAELYGRRV